MKLMRGELNVMMDQNGGICGPEHRSATGTKNDLRGFTRRPQTIVIFRDPVVFGRFGFHRLSCAAPALLLGVVAFGRVVGLVADGFDKAVVPPLVVELVIIAVLISAYMQLGG